jgi:hypothetical protein
VTQALRPALCQNNFLARQNGEARNLSREERKMTTIMPLQQKEKAVKRLVLA